MAINFDVVFTLWNSFSRGKNLKIIILTSKVLIFVYVILLIIMTGNYLTRLKRDFYTEKKALIEQGLYQQLNVYIYNSILHLEIINIIVMAVSLIVIIVSLVRRRGAKFKDETH